MDINKKRGEMREGISAKQNRLYRGICTILNETENMIPAGRSERILKFLHSVGCVLKVERELPDETLVGVSEYYIKRVLNAGYEAVVPLIEEKDADTVE